VRVIPLGGVEEIGKNMTVVEYKDEIVIIDAGFQFTDEDSPGVDFMIPNVKYLEDNKHKVKALFITHGHYDHIGAIPYIMGRIGNPPIYSMQFGAAIIEKRQIEFPDSPPLRMNIVKGHEVIKISEHFTVEFFDISHAIPDAMGIIIGTPNGNIVTVSDVRVDHLDGIVSEKEIEHYKPLRDRKVKLFMLDSTSIEKPGFSRPESLVIKTIDLLLKNANGRFIIATFASQVERVIEFIKMAEKYNKKVVIDGRSMKTNVDIVKQLNILKLENLIPLEEMANYPTNKIVVIATGAQGEQYSVLDRIANNNHRFIRLNKTDTVVLSSSIIPGNDFAIAKLKDSLYRQEAKIITYTDADVHASGHGNRGELEWIHSQVNYDYFMPMHGHHYMLRIHAEMAQSRGVAEDHVLIPDNGSIIEIRPDGTVVKLKEKVVADAVAVEGSSVRDMSDVLMRDRKLLGEEGFVVVVAMVNPKTGYLKKSPDIISRGFVYLRESQEMLSEARHIIKKSIESSTANQNPINFDYAKNAVSEDLSRFLFQRTQKKPIVIPVILSV
jgi:ribonuclease J